MALNQNESSDDKLKMHILQTEIGKACAFYHKKLDFAKTMSSELVELGLAKCTSNIEKGSELERHIPRVQLDQNEILMSNFSDLYRFHIQEGRLNFEADFLDGIQDIIYYEKTLVYIYTIYKQNHLAQRSILTMMHKRDNNKYFENVQRKYGQPFMYDGTFISSPMKMVNIYLGYIKAIQRHLERNTIWKRKIEKAIEILENLKAKLEITPSAPWLWDLDLGSILCDRTNLVEHCKLHLQGTVKVLYADDRSGWNKFKRAIKPRRRRVLVYEKCIIIGKRCKQDGIKAMVPIISCENFIYNENAILTETEQDDPRKFAIYDNSTNSKVVFKINNTDKKDKWITALELIMTKDGDRRATFIEDEDNEEDEVRNPTIPQQNLPKSYHNKKLYGSSV